MIFWKQICSLQSYYIYNIYWNTFDLTSFIYIFNIKWHRTDEFVFFLNKPACISTSTVYWTFFFSLLILTKKVVEMWLLQISMFPTYIIYYTLLTRSRSFQSKRRFVFTNGFFWGLLKFLLSFIISVAALHLWPIIPALVCSPPFEGSANMKYCLSQEEACIFARTCRVQSAHLRRRWSLLNSAFTGCTVTSIGSLFMIRKYCVLLWWQHCEIKPVELPKQHCCC